MMVAAVILAGGKSARMGFDKALIHRGSATLLQHTCQIALACTPWVYVVTPWGDRYRDYLPPTVTILPEPPSTHPEDRRPGPLVALSQAVTGLLTNPQTQRIDPANHSAITGGAGEALAGDLSQWIAPQWILALPCDMPNLTATMLQGWLQALETLPPDILAYLPQRQGCWEPLCGFYRVQCVDSWKQYLATGERSFQGWLAQHPIAQIPNVAEAWLTNLNTPADLAQWQERFPQPTELA